MVFDMKGYIPRIADNILRDELESKGAVLIAGPKWCGKSTTALQQAIDYYDGLVLSDGSRVDGVRRDPERMRLLLRFYARHISRR